MFSANNLHLDTPAGFSFSAMMILYRCMDKSWRSIRHTVVDFKLKDEACFAVFENAC